MNSDDVLSQELTPLFSTPLWVFGLQAAMRDAMNTGLLARLQGITQGREGQTRQDLHEDPAFAELVNFIRYGAKAALGSLAMDQYPFDITALWANIHYPGSYHQAHVHPNNFLGGTYYLQVAEGNNEIIFTDPRPAAVFMRPLPATQNGLNAFAVPQRVEPGQLVMFPAWLSHQVPQNESSEARITLSFNIMFSDFTTLSKPQWQPKID